MLKCSMITMMITRINFGIITVEPTIKFGGGHQCTTVAGRAYR